MNRGPLTVNAPGCACCSAGAATACRGGAADNTPGAAKRAEELLSS